MMKEIVSFSKEIDKLASKHDVIYRLLDTLSLIFPSKFASYVEKKEGTLKVLCQLGEDKAVKNIFGKEMSEHVFDWVINQGQLASLKLGNSEQFIFMPLIDYDSGSKIEHGMLVFNLGNSTFEFTKEQNFSVNVISKLASLSMTKFLKDESSQKYSNLQERIKSELKVAAKVQSSISRESKNKKILVSVLEDKEASFNGNLWWMGELGADITLVLIAQILCKGIPSAVLSGYMLGEMNSLKANAEISLKPSEVLKHLNQELNSIFINTSITVNAWYGVFNIGARKVRFANASHPDPFLIGPEQQVTNLFVEKGKSLGLSLDSVFTEASSYVANGSKLVICTKDLLEQAAKVGEKYDPTWLPQVLETLGTLSLTEMRNNLENILSENSNGTANKPSRLALLLEIPS